jgi:MerR family transcriptional regulator, light-induced transcriptional regulator
MPPIDDTPIYNLKAVVQETGLKPDTLRAWERRYGLPEPDRTTGGHRLYSQRDIEVLKWLISRQDEGLSISRAVDLWNTLRNENQDPLAMPEYSGPIQSSARISSISGGESLDGLREAWIDACLAFNGLLAEGLLVQALAQYPAEIVCFEVLQKGLHEIGEGWYRGDFTVQQEHFASALAMRRLEALVAGAPAPTRTGRILIGCPPGEDHTFSPLLLTLLIKRQGYDVIYLGANIPVEQLEHTIATARPDLVIMAAQQLHSAASLIQVGILLQRMRVPLGFGGRIFNDVDGLHERIPGHFLGTRLDQAVNVIDNLLAGRQPIGRVAPLAEPYQRALSRFREERPKVEGTLWQQLETSGMTHATMNIANLNFGRSIEAALMLGDLNSIRPDLSWIRGLLQNYNMPEMLLGLYLHAYRDAVIDVMGEQDGAIVADWLESMEVAR